MQIRLTVLAAGCVVAVAAFASVGRGEAAPFRDIGLVHANEELSNHKDVQYRRRYFGRYGYGRRYGYVGPRRYFGPRYGYYRYGYYPAYAYPAYSYGYGYGYPSAYYPAYSYYPYYYRPYVGFGFGGIRIGIW